MKPTLLWMSALVVTCALCSCLTAQFAYRSGFHNGYQQGATVGLNCGDFSESLCLLISLQKLRAHDFPGATRFMETNCFDRANAFFKFQTPAVQKINPWARTQNLLASPDNNMTHALAQQLTQYRTAIPLPSTP